MNVVLENYNDASPSLYEDFKNFWVNPREEYYSEEKAETPSSEE